MKQIDLEPSEYKSEPRLGEPFFGNGWPFGVAAVITIAVGVIFHDSATPVHIAGAIGGAILIGVVHQFLR
jgi:hypothetical protein